MILSNPLERDVAITYRGIPYTIEAGKSLDLPDDVAEHWLSIHAFLEVDTAPKATKETNGKEDKSDKEDK